MIALDQLTDEQFERHALDVFKRELARFALSRRGFEKGFRSRIRLQRARAADWRSPRD